MKSRIWGEVPSVVSGYCLNSLGGPQNHQAQSPAVIFALEVSAVPDPVFTDSETIEPLHELKEFKWIT